MAFTAIGGMEIRLLIPFFCSCFLFFFLFPSSSSLSSSPPLQVRSAYCVTTRGWWTSRERDCVAMLILRFKIDFLSEILPTRNISPHSPTTTANNKSTTPYNSGLYIVSSHPAIDTREYAGGSAYDTFGLYQHLSFALGLQGLIWPRDMHLLNAYVRT